MHNTVILYIYEFQNIHRDENSESVSHSVVSDSATPWTVALQDPVREILQTGTLEWVAIPPSPGDLPDPQIEPGSPALQEDLSTI